MDALDQLLRQRMDELVARQPGLDPVRAGCGLVDLTPVGAALDTMWKGFREATRSIVRAHGCWEAWHDEAAELAGLGTHDLQLAHVEVLAAGWSEPSGAWPLAVRLWRRVRLEPTAGMTDRALIHTRKAFHRSRLFDHQMAPPVVRDALHHWTGWSDAPRIAQWRQVAERRLTPDEACPETLPWALFNASRQAHLRGWADEAQQIFATAKEASVDPQARFVVGYIEAMRAVLGDGDAEPLVQALRELTCTDEDRLLLLQLEVEHRRRRGEPVEDVLFAGVHLAQRLQVPAREIHFRHLLARENLQHPGELRRHLETIEAMQAEVVGPFAFENRYLWACLLLAEGDLEAVRRHVTTELGGPFEDGSRGCLLALRVAVGHLLGEPGATGDLAEARRLAMGTVHEPFVRWAERVVAQGPDALHPLPFLPPARFRVAEDGSWFEVEGVRHDLTDSPLARGLLRALAAKPRDAHALIEAIWPGDASSYSSLKNRLYSLIRSARKRGLGEHLVFEGDVYRLRDVVVVRSRR